MILMNFGEILDSVVGIRTRCLRYAVVSEVAGDLCAVPLLRSRGTRYLRALRCIYSSP